MARPEKVSLTDLLVQAKPHITRPTQVGRVCGSNASPDRKPWRLLVDNDFVTEEQIAQVLAKHLDIPYVNLKYYNVNPGLVKLLPENQHG